MSEYQRRKAVNEASRNEAVHDREPWLDYEDDLLITWTGNEEELRVAASLLGRTVEACRQRFYTIRRYGTHGAPSRNDLHVPTNVVPVCPVCNLQHRGEC